jgi:hypothetical protein
MSDQATHHADDFSTAGPPACPRCGYDQRGVIDTWIECSPVLGRCAECGLEFRWVSVLQPFRFAPQWSIEFEPKRRRLVHAAARTITRSLRPWWFWRRFNMSHPVRGGRLAMYVALLLLPLALIYVGAQTTVALRVRTLVRNDAATFTANRNQSLITLQWYLDAPRGSFAGPWSDAEYEQARRQWQATIDQIKAVGDVPVTVRMPYWRVIMEAVFTPLSSSTSGSIYEPAYDASMPYVSPKDLWLAAIEGSTTPYTVPPGMPAPPRRIIASPIVSALIIVVPSGAVTLLVICLAILLPLSLALLPITRRRAKVRWAHVGRVFAYSWFIPASLVYVAVVAVVIGVLHRPFAPTAAGVIGWGSLAGLLGMTAWWAAAIRVYLRMPHAWPVAILLTIMNILAVAATAFLAGVWFPRAW